MHLTVKDLDEDTLNMIHKIKTLISGTKAVNKNMISSRTMSLVKLQ
jgi:hypothetical protein